MNVLYPGPCMVCGLGDYLLSVGGPGICPTCDTGMIGTSLIEAQRQRIARLERDLVDAQHISAERGMAIEDLRGDLDRLRSLWSEFGILVTKPR